MQTEVIKCLSHLYGLGATYTWGNIFGFVSGKCYIFFFLASETSVL